MQRFIKHRGLPILQKKCAQIALVNKSNKKYLVIILQQQDTLAVYLLLSLFLFPLLSFSFFPYLIASSRCCSGFPTQYCIPNWVTFKYFAICKCHTHSHTDTHRYTLTSNTRVQFSWVQLDSPLSYACVLNFQIVFVANFHLFTVKIDCPSKSIMNKLGIYILSIYSDLKILLFHCDQYYICLESAKNVKQENVNNMNVSNHMHISITNSC